MNQPLEIDGKIYISSSRASEITKYSKDYIGQLCRGGQVEAKRVGRSWFVSQESILRHKKNVDEQLRQPKKWESNGDTNNQHVSHHTVNTNNSLNTSSDIFLQDRVNAIRDKNSIFKYSADDRPLLPQLQKDLLHKDKDLYASNKYSQKIIGLGVNNKLPVNFLSNISKYGATMYNLLPDLSKYLQFIKPHFFSFVLGLVTISLFTTALVGVFDVTDRTYTNSFALNEKNIVERKLNSFGMSFGKNSLIIDDSLEQGRELLSKIDSSKLLQLDLSSYRVSLSANVIDSARDNLSVLVSNVKIGLRNFLGIEDDFIQPVNIINVSKSNGPIKTSNNFAVAQSSTTVVTRYIAPKYITNVNTDQSVLDKINNVDQRLTDFQIWQRAQDSSIADSIGRIIASAISRVSVSSSSSGGSGSVTSIDVSGGTTGLSFSGGPITSSGTITLNGTLGIGNGGTNSTSQIANSLLWYDGTSITATSSYPLTVGYLIATTSQASVLPYASSTMISLTTASTTNLTISSLGGLGNRCLHTDQYGNVTATSADCGSGSGSGGGTWATTTSTVSGEYVNYSLNNTDVIAIGSNSTTSAKYYFDPNTQTAYLAGDVTVGSTLTANTLNLTNSLAVGYGGTGATSFGQGWLYSSGGTTALGASTSPTVNYIVATSTTASILPYASTTMITATTASTTDLYVSNNAYFRNGVWNSSGKVGIGTASPTTDLQVNGLGLFKGTLPYSDNIAASPLQVQGYTGNSVFGIATGSGTDGQEMTQLVISNWYPVGSGQGAYLTFNQENTAMGNLVGGETDVTTKSGFFIMRVKGPSTNFYYDPLIAYSNGILVGQDYNTVPTTQPDASLVVRNRNFSNPSVRIEKHSSQTSDLLQFIDSDGSTVMNVVDDSGNLGLGSSSPSTLLSVQGSGYISSNLFVGGTITSTTTTASSTLQNTELAQLKVGTLSGVLKSVSGFVQGSATTDDLTEGSTNKYYSDTLVNNYIAASTTIPKTYSANTYTGLQTFGNNISLGGAQLNTTALTYGDMFVYNGTNWVNTATSTLKLNTDNLVEGSTNKFYSNTLVNNYIDASSTIVKAYSTNTISGLTSFTNTATTTFAGGIQGTYLNLTGTTATSTASNGISLSSGCFAINGVCVGTNQGTVTSIATGNGLSGGTITTSGTIAINSAGLVTNALTTWNGTNFVATGTPSLTVGYLIATSTTASSTLQNTELAQLKVGTLSGVLKSVSGFVQGSATTDDLTEGSTNKYYSNTLVNNYIAASTTIPKTYSANTYTAMQTFGNNISFGGGSVNISSLNAGDLLQFNGNNWVDSTVASLGTIGITAGNGLSGGGTPSLGGSATLSINSTNLITNALTTWNGTNFVATGTPSLTVGYLISTSTTASVLPYASTTMVTATNASTTNLTISSLGGLGNRCLHTDQYGNVTATSADCGSGSGSGGGTWATTTSTVSGEYVNYSLNNTDVVAIGSNSTTSAKYYFDPNTSTSYLAGTVTIGSNLIVSGAATSTYTGGIQASYLNLTGTTATSTASNGISLSSGCFAINGVCVGTNQGTVTSIATGNGLSGGTITTSGTIAINSDGLVTNALTTWNGTNFVATGTPSLTVGYLISTSTTASVLPYASTTALDVSGTAYFPGSGVWNSSGNLGIGTTSPSRTLSVQGSGYISSNLFVGGNITSTSTTASSTLQNTELAQLKVGTLSGVLKSVSGFVQGSATTDDLTEGSTNKYYSNTLVNNYIAASTTIPKTYSANTYTAMQTFGNNISFGGGIMGVSTLNAGDLLQFNGNNWVDSTVASLGTIGITAGNGLSGGGTPSLGGSATLSINSTNLITNTLTTWNGTNFVATGTPSLTVGYLIATSTTASSTLQNTELAQLKVGTLSGVLKSVSGFVQGSATTDDLTEGSTNKYYSNTLVNNYIAASTTIPKTYSSNTYVGLQTFGNNISLGGAQLNTTALTYGDMFVYNGTNWVNTATSTLKLNTDNLVEGSTNKFYSNTLVNNYIDASTTIVKAYSTNTISGLTSFTNTATTTFAGGLQGTYLNLTGTTATSTASNGINLSAGCFSINGVCVGGGGGSGTVTSIATGNGLTGGTITTSGTIAINSDGLVTNALTTWNGTNFVATGTPSLTVGYLISTSTTASVLPYASTTALGVSGTAYFPGSGIWNSSGYLGIGTTSPYSQVSIHRNTSDTTYSPLFSIASSTDSATSTLFTILNNGYVGIGSSTQPVAQLHIKQAGNFTTSTAFTGQVSDAIYISRYTSVGANTYLGSIGFERSDTGVGSRRAAIAAVQTGSDQDEVGFAIFTHPSITGTDPLVETVRINDEGYMGLGTTTPYSLLSVQGSGYISSNLFVGGYITSTSTTASVLPYASTTALGVSGTAYFANNGIWNSNGFVGIGTTSPYAVLSVVGAGGVVADSYNATNTSATSTFAGGLAVGGGLLNYDFSTGITSINSLQVGGALNFDTNAGAVQWVDLPTDSSSLAGTVQSYTASLNGSSTITVYGLSNGSGYLYDDFPRVAIGSSTAPSSKLTVFSNGTGSNGTFELVNSASTTLFKVLDNGNVGIGSTSPGTVFGIQSGATGIANFTTATSTIYNNLDVRGTGHAGIWYTGDLFFANNFSFTEAPAGTTTQALVMENQNGLPVMTVDEFGNLSVIGDICANNINCFGKSIGALTDALSKISSSTTGLSEDLLKLGDTASTTSITLQSLSDAITALNLRIDDLATSTGLVANIASSTALSVLDSNMERIASSTTDQIVKNASFISVITESVKTALQSVGEWVVNKLSAKIVYSTRIETQTAAVSQGIEMTDQVTGKIYCITIKNGNFDKQLGTCTTSDSTTTSTSTTSTSTTTTDSSITTPTIPTTPTTPTIPTSPVVPTTDTDTTSTSSTTIDTSTTSSTTSSTTPSTSSTSPTSEATTTSSTDTPATASSTSPVTDSSPDTSTSGTPTSDSSTSTSASTDTSTSASPSTETSTGSSGTSGTSSTDTGTGSSSTSGSGVGESSSITSGSGGDSGSSSGTSSTSDSSSGSSSSSSGSTGTTESSPSTTP